MGRSAGQQSRAHDPVPGFGIPSPRSDDRRDALTRVRLATTERRNKNGLTVVQTVSWLVEEFGAG
jgi:hypothetical protein